jgi:predicted DNA-binding transcriptional regulator AlpA
MTKKLIGKIEVSELLGSKNPNFPFERMKVDPGFPEPEKVGRGQGGRTLWNRADILDYKKTFKLRKHITTYESEKALSFSNEMAQKFIRLRGRYWLYDRVNWGAL